MITHYQAFHADEFHIAHAGLPCTVWRRNGRTYANGDDSFIVFIVRAREDGYAEWHHITGVNAADFHVPDECPRRHREGNADQPPAGSDRSEHQPVLDNGTRDDDGYNALGFDAEGYDENGYDKDGYDAEGYDAEGYDENGYDEDGYDEDDRDRYGQLRDLDELWDGFSCRPGRWGYVREDFREYLRDIFRNPGTVDEVTFCANCDAPAWDNDLSEAGNGDSVCGSCWDDFASCDRCEERFPGEDLTETLSGSDICRSCRTSYCTWCDYCDGYYWDDDAYEHEHDSDGDGCCDSPQPEFRIRNDGNDPLKNDTKVTVTLPAGTISAEGITAIRQYLRSQGHYDVSYLVEELGDQWQTREGNFSKRLSRHAYKQYQAKLTPDVLSQVGTIARDHSKPVDVQIDVTRDLNAPASDFYHGGSCWWGSYSESRCALKTNGGFGLRTFSCGSVSGRAWVMPLRLDPFGELTPTFDTMTPDAFVVFNGYGDLSGYAPARIMAHMAGWTYRKIAFSCEPMYINAGGYLIAPEHIADPYTDGSLHLSVDQHSDLYHTEQRELSHA